MRLLLFILPLILTGCGYDYHIDNSNKPRFKFGDTVTVTSGFFKGCSGKTSVIDYGAGWIETSRSPGLFGKWDENVYGHRAYRYNIAKVKCSAELSADQLTNIEEDDLVGEYGK